MIYLKLFFEFFKTGLFSVGGGLATIPFLQTMGETTGWFTDARLADMIAVSESTPGPVGVNMATYVGFETAGIPGAVIATLGLITPSIIVILIIAEILKQFRENKFVNAGFYGLRPASVGLITASGVSIGVITFAGEAFDVKKLILAAVLIVLTRFVKATKKWHPLAFIAIAATVGIIFKF